MLIYLALALIVGLVIAALGSQLVRRIAFRNAVRRPREAMLVMLGCVLGTALIVGSGSVADSFTASIRDQALTKLGPIDARINYESATDWAAANARLNASPIPGVQIAAATATLEVPLTSDTSPTPAPRAKLIEVDYRRAGELAATDGVPAGTGPTPGTAWVSPNLATHLHLKVNSVLTVHTAVPEQQLRVTRIVTTALVTFNDSPLDSGDNLLVTPGTIAILHQQDTKALVPHYVTLVAATGPHTKKPAARHAVERLRNTLADLVSPFNGSVAMVRADSLKAAAEVGASAGQFLVTIGAFGILAGIMLLINVLLMLAEERMAELGTMRAVGLARRPLIASFALEGAAYSIVGALVGGGAGIGIGRFMVKVASRATGPGVRNADGLAIHFAVEPKTVLSGVAAGFLVSTLVVLATSYRISRLDVIRALRGLPDPPRRHRQAATPLLVAGLIVGPMLCFYGYSAPAAVPFALGPPIFFACGGVFVARRRGYVAGITASCGPNVVWTVAFQILNRDGQAPPSVTVFLGVLIVMSGVLFVNAQQFRLATLVRRLGRGRATITTRLGMANPIAHRVRLLLTVAPFALVVFTLVYTEGLTHLFTTEVQRLAPVVGGDYQVFATSSPAHPFDFSKLDATGVRAVARTSTVIASFKPNPDAQQRFWQVSAFDASISKIKPPLLLARSSAYKSDEAAYAGVAKNPDLIIVPANFLFGANRVGISKDDPKRGPLVGDTYTMFDPASGAARDLVVAAVSYNDVTGSGAFYGAAGAKSLFGARLVKTSAFISATADPHALVSRLEQAGVDNGLRADVIADAANRYFAFINDLLDLYRSDLGVGIVVGIAGIGVVLVRSVRDRRRQIGTLRAIGFDANQIGWSFLIEGAYVALQGLAVGVGLGVVTVMALSQGALVKQILGQRPPLSTPSVTTLILAIGLFVASILASVSPARSASKIPPAVALRLVD